jgi:biopolymer transport protein ExbD
MITRPLDLASRLRPPPRNFDGFFVVNGGLVLFFFALLGSRFVLAPGLGVDFQLPEIPGARAEAVRTTHDIAVKEGGLIIAGNGSITKKSLGEWLKGEAKITKEPVLLVRADARVPWSDLADILGLAREAGFRVQLAAEDPAARQGGR